MQIGNPEKCFSIGLALDSAPEEYEKLFRDYGRYIDNLYFSPPLGTQFHGRTKIAEQLENPEYISRFWEILHVAGKAGIKLEVVYNTHLLSEQDLYKAREAFNDNGITLSKICVQDAYFDCIRSLYPGTELVHSVNCMPDNRDMILETSGLYSEYVVGRQYTRDADLFEGIEKTGARCVLLLNNGCSHFCGGCAAPEHCFKAFEKTQKDHNMSPEQIYALQSIMPFELHEGLIDLTHVSLLKLSTRNADVPYITACLDSYINCRERELIEKSTDYYLLWARLFWFTGYFGTFDFDRICEYKKDLVKKL